MAATPAAPEAPVSRHHFAPPRQPPIGIVHIMMWTAGSAVILGAHRWLVGADDVPSQHASFLNVMNVFWSVLYGTALGGVVLFVYRRLTRGVAFPVQPGHWLLLVAGFTCIIAWSLFALFRWVDSWDNTNGGYNLFWVVYYLGALSCEAVVLGWAGWQFRGERYWRLYFWFRLRVKRMYGDRASTLAS